MTAPIELATTSRGSGTRPGMERCAVSIAEVRAMLPATATHHSREPNSSSTKTPTGTNRPTLARNSTRSTLSRAVTGSRSGYLSSRASTRAASAE